MAKTYHRSKKEKQLILLRNTSAKSFFSGFSHVIVLLYIRCAMCMGETLDEDFQRSVQTNLSAPSSEIMHQ